MVHIPDRPCARCDAVMTDTAVIDSWGDEPHPMQVLCYECDECGAVTGYFRRDSRHSDLDTEAFVDREFVCPSRAVYNRLFGQTDAFYTLAEQETGAVPDETYDALCERGTDESIVSSILVPQSVATEDVRTIRLGTTLALPESVFDTLHRTLFGSWHSQDDDWKGDWFMTEHLRFVRQESDAADYHNPEKTATD